MDLRVAVILVAACSGGKTKPVVEDARRPTPSDAATPVIALAVATPYRTDKTAKTGDVQVRVEWRDVPQALRAPGPTTRCGGPRVPVLVPTTMWGVPDVLVAIDVDHGKAFTPTRPRIVVEDCAFAPRAVVAGEAVAIASAMHEPITVTLQEVARPLGGAAVAGKPRALYLPIAGHEIEAALEPNTVYTIAFGGDDVAALVSATTPYVATTEASGNVVLRDVPVGTYPVRAWLPARGGNEARAAATTVTVTEGALAEVTLDISRP